jgi:hypothetical protein
MSQASVGLIALWTGELCANVEHMKDMSIHTMTDADLDQFAKYVSRVLWSAQSIAKYVKEKQEQS